MYGLMISIMIDTIEGFRIQFFKSMRRPVRLMTMTRFRIKLIDRATMKPNINPGIPNFGIIKNTNNIRVL